MTVLFSDKQKTIMETYSVLNTRSSMLDQVARSKGNEWMISSYKAWQKRSPLGRKSKKEISSIMWPVSRLDL